MNRQYNPGDTYLTNTKRFSEALALLLKKRSRLGWLRLFFVLVLILLAYFSFVHWIAAGVLVVVAGIAVFLAIVSIDEKNSRKISHLQTLIAINRDELEILDFHFHHREAGEEHLPHDHPYAHDLDLFGTASVYQYANRCTSQQGKYHFAQSLLTPSSPEIILKRQPAIEKLSSEINWQQEFIASGMENPVSFLTENKISRWLSESMPFREKGWQTLVTIYSLATIGAVAAYFFGLIPSPAFGMLVLLFFIAALQISKSIQPIWLSLSGIADEIGTIQKKIKLVENVPVSNDYIEALKQRLGKNEAASTTIYQLQRILDRFDYRLNILVFFILNTFLLWDLRQLISLQKWKKDNENDVQSWFEVMAEMELLNSFSILRFNHPAWVFPIVEKEHFVLDAKEVGHPLIRAEKRIDNSFSVTGNGKVSVITGSNMAGKSTFLRSLGVNMVLAQAGSVVCAKSFHFSPVLLYSSMRIADNLAENTSTFYAELKKLKSIIDEVNKGAQIFILLDEILRGTNSLDRHTGSEALIKQFIKHDAVAVIATHDVELGALQNQYPSAIDNYHFDVQVEGEELYFDYKLKRGICQSMNASLLMKKIGIELES